MIHRFFIHYLSFILTTVPVDFARPHHRLSGFCAVYVPQLMVIELMAGNLASPMLLNFVRVSLDGTSGTWAKGSGHTASMCYLGCGFMWFLCSTSTYGLHGLQHFRTCLGIVKWAMLSPVNDAWMGQL